MPLSKRLLSSCALLIAGMLSVAPSSARYPAIVQVGCQAVSCPPCHRDLPPLEGSGTATDGSNRRILKVHIDSTWGNPTNENVFNRTNEAISDWNSAVDTTCTPPTQKTGYLLVLDQNAAVGSRDVVITKNDNTGGFCAVNTHKISHARPDTIKLIPVLG
jgi:hypothetical protein